MALFYPLYLVSMALLNLAPPVLRGQTDFELVVNARYIGPANWRDDIVAHAIRCTIAVVALAITLAVRPMGRYWGFAPALLASEILSRAIFPLLYGRQTPSVIFVAPVALACLAVALWLVRDRGAIAGLIATLLAFDVFLTRDLWRALLIWSPSALVGAVALLSIARGHRPLAFAWWAPVAGTLLTAFTAFVVSAADQRLNFKRQERDRTDRAAALASAPKPDPNAPYRKLFFQKGVNFTAEYPANYRSARVVSVLDRLRGYGVDSIALVPYAFMRDSGTPVVRFRRSGGMEAIEDIHAVAALARERGIKVLLKPHIWVGGGTGFPGAVEMRNDLDRMAWFESYRQFIEFYAEEARRMHADLFCVGVELSKMSMHENEWRRIIEGVRKLYPGPLVYGAIQGQEFETVKFWDALDYIGLNNYYPLPDSLDPSAMVRTVERVQRRFSKPVIFTEAGYSSLENAHREPWSETPRMLSMEHQSRCYEALFGAFYAKPWFYGFYWWKVGTNGFGGPEDGSHTPWRKPAMDVVGKWYKSSQR